MASDEGREHEERIDEEAAMDRRKERESGAGTEGFHTKAARCPRTPPLDLEPLSVPLQLGTIFRARTSEELGATFRKKAPGVYSRFGHPVLSAAADKLAELEGAEAGLVSSSGMAAITTALFAVLEGGDHVVCQSFVFAQTGTFLREFLDRFGVETTFVESTEPEVFAQALTERTRVVYLETPSNPLLEVVDIAAVAAAVRRARPDAFVFVDNTFATPYLQNPLALGASLVLHSASKYLAGHADVLCGAVAGSSELVRRIKDAQILLGGILDPHGAWLLMRGIRTLGLRVQRASDNALALARFLSGKPGITAVHYPWLEGSRQRAVATAQMRAGGAMISFEVAGGLEGARRFVDALESIAIATSLGGVESVIEVPYELDWHESEGVTDGAVPPGLVRFSVGIEDVLDLERDLELGLRAVERAAVGSPSISR